MSSGAYDNAGISLSSFPDSELQASGSHPFVPRRLTFQPSEDSRTGRATVMRHATPDFLMSSPPDQGSWPAAGGLAGSTDRNWPYETSTLGFANFDVGDAMIDRSLSNGLFISREEKNAGSFASRGGFREGDSSPISALPTVSGHQLTFGPHSSSNTFGQSFAFSPHVVHKRLLSGDSECSMLIDRVRASMGGSGSLLADAGSPVDGRLSQTELDRPQSRERVSSETTSGTSGSRPLELPGRVVSSAAPFRAATAGTNRLATTSINRLSTGTNRLSTGETRLSSGESRSSTGANRLSTGTNRVSTGTARLSTSSHTKSHGALSSVHFPPASSSYIDPTRPSNNRLSGEFNRASIGSHRVSTGSNRALGSAGNGRMSTGSNRMSVGPYRLSTASSRENAEQWSRDRNRLSGASLASNGGDSELFDSCDFKDVNMDADGDTNIVGNGSVIGCVGRFNQPMPFNQPTRIPSPLESSQSLSQQYARPTPKVKVRAHGDPGLSDDAELLRSEEHTMRPSEQDLAISALNRGNASYSLKPRLTRGLSSHPSAPPNIVERYKQEKKRRTDVPATARDATRSRQISVESSESLTSNNLALEIGSRAKPSGAEKGRSRNGTALNGFPDVITGGQSVCSFINIQPNSHAEADSHPFCPGSVSSFCPDPVFSGRLKREFRAIAPVGKGSYSVVYKATSNVDGETYAVKVVTSHLTSNSSVVVKDAVGMMEEAKVLARISRLNKPLDRSDSVVRYHTSWWESASETAKPVLCIQMECCPLTVRQLVVALKGRENTASSSADNSNADNSNASSRAASSVLASSVLAFWTEARFSLVLCWLRAVSQGLTFLHGNDIAHLDIKPDNVFVSTDKSLDEMVDSLTPTHIDDILLTDRLRLKLGDFGLARDFGCTTVEQAGSVSCIPTTSGLGFRSTQHFSRHSEVSSGDARYLAREMLNLEQGIDSNSSPLESLAQIKGKCFAGDVFAMGVAGFEIATGQELPSHGPAWHELRDNSELILRTLEQTIVPNSSTAALVRCSELIVACMSVDGTKRPKACQIYDAFSMSGLRLASTCASGSTCANGELGRYVSQLSGPFIMGSPEKQGLNESRSEIAGG